MTDVKSGTALTALVANLKKELAPFPAAAAQACWTHENPHTSAHACLRDSLAYCEAALEAAAARSPWQPIETAPKDGKPFIVYWRKSLIDDAQMDMVAGWDEYAEILSYGEPPATHWARLDPPVAHPEPER